MSLMIQGMNFLVVLRKPSDRRARTLFGRCRSFAALRTTGAGPSLRSGRHVSSHCHAPDGSCDKLPHRDETRSALLKQLDHFPQAAERDFAGSETAVVPEPLTCEID